MSLGDWIALGSLIPVIGSLLSVWLHFHSRRQRRQIGLLNELKRLADFLGKNTKGQIFVQNSLALRDLAERITTFNDISRKLPSGHRIWVTQTLVPGLEQIVANATDADLHADEPRWMAAISAQRDCSKILKAEVEQMILRLHKKAESV